jgi:thiamine biosynthesis lipoprotein
MIESYRYTFTLESDMKSILNLNIFATLLVIVLVTACDKSQNVFDHKLQILGTFAEISIAGIPNSDARNAAQSVEKYLGKLDHIGYTFASDGELHELNSAIAQGAPMTVSDDLRDLIETAREIYSASDGLVNAAAGELTDLWEYHCKEGDCAESPYPEEVQHLVQEKEASVVAMRPSMIDVILDGNSVSSRNPLLKLEFGDIIRGYALDKGIDHLQKSNIRDAMIDVGGSVRSVGSRGEHPWWSPVHDASGKHSVGYVELNRNEAIVTARAFEISTGKQGVVYRHVVDPRTGIPVKSVKAVTVIHDTAVWANAAATALLVAGLDDWSSIAGKMGVRSVMMITQNGTIYTSTSMDERIHWKERLEHQRLIP